jgi:hypothetical protein
MNLKSLEKLTHGLIRGRTAEEEIRHFAEGVPALPVEHRTLQALSWQIAASARRSPSPERAWPLPDASRWNGRRR